jgi:hypothetical protein
MSHASADPTSQPYPTAGASKQSRVGRLLALVRKLIDYGRDLAAKVQSRAPAAEIRHFDTSDIALILARINQGLHRAQVLEERLIRDAGHLDAPRRPQTTPATHKLRATHSAAECSQSSDPPLALLPTPEQIAAEVRRRPIGAVLADICRDLGILPSHPLWRELSDAIMFNGGNLARLVKEIISQGARRFAQAWAETPIHSQQFLPCLSHAGTGPP